MVVSLLEWLNCRKQGHLVLPLSELKERDVVVTFRTVGAGCMDAFQFMKII